MSLMLMAAAAGSVDYSLAIANQHAMPSPVVTMTFTGEADGSTDIDLPDRWAGSGGLARNLVFLDATGGHRLHNPDPAHWRIAHRPNARVTVRYALRDGQPGNPDARTFEKAHPVIEPDWFQLHGEGAIAIPGGQGRMPARFAWGPMPGGWSRASDLDHASAFSANDVGGAIFVGGSAFAEHRRTIGSRTLTVAAVGARFVDLTVLTDRIARIVATENEMLEAKPVDYLVTLSPIAGASRGSLSYGGSGRTAGFALTATTNVTLDDMTRLVAHEYAHRWFGRGFGPVDEGAGPYWFTEGVNDWFSARAMLASGLWQPTDWARSVNEMLLRYGMSRARKLSPREITDRFWTDPDAMQVQYDRGHLTAMLVDRDLPGGLLPILRTLQATPATISEEQALLSMAGPIGTESLARSADPLPNDLVAPCATLDRVERHRYDRGFDLDDRDVVTAVREPAAAAGVRVGMRYVRRVSRPAADSTIRYAAVFSDGHQEQQRSWWPRGAETVVIQQVALVTPIPAACLSRSATITTPQGHGHH